MDRHSSFHLNLLFLNNYSFLKELFKADAGIFFHLLSLDSVSIL